MQNRSEVFPFLEKGNDNNNFRISSSFGNRVLNGVLQNHKGIDIGCYQYTPLFAPFAGTVTYIGIDNPTAGNYIILRRDNGYVVRFLHLQDIAQGIKVGERIEFDRQIARTGKSGTKQAHLHLDIAINGQYVDPLPYLRQIGQIQGI